MASRTTPLLRYAYSISIFVYLHGVQPFCVPRFEQAFQITTHPITWNWQTCSIVMKTEAKASNDVSQFFSSPNSALFSSSMPPASTIPNVQSIETNPRSHSFNGQLLNSVPEQYWSRWMNLCRRCQLEQQLISQLAAARSPPTNLPYFRGQLTRSPTCSCTSYCMIFVIDLHRNPQPISPSNLHSAPSTIPLCHNFTLTYIMTTVKTVIILNPWLHLYGSVFPLCYSRKLTDVHAECWLCAKTFVTSSAVSMAKQRRRTLCWSRWLNGRSCYVQVVRTPFFPNADGSSRGLLGQIESPA